MICENCGKEHNGSYSSGRFCSEKCARAFATKYEKDTTKIVKCNNCGIDIIVNKRASKKTWLCNSCKQNVLTTNIKQLKTCSICGSKYIKGHSCNNEFCKQHNIKQLSTLVKYFNFDKTTIGTPNVENEFNRIRDLLNYLYTDQCKSFSEIAKIFNYTSNPGNLSKIFKYLNIPVRTLSEANINSYLLGNHSLQTSQKYKTGWHTTWDGNDVYLRSSYEFNFAEQLDSQRIKYDVEALKIKYYDTQRAQYRCAIPDFYIYDTNTIIEIKSSWTLDKQNMIDKFIAYKQLGYNCKCICDNIEVEIMQN